jgi:hypothetical protein
MTGTNRIPPESLIAALEAIGNLAAQDLNEIFTAGQFAALSAHTEIETCPVDKKIRVFLKHFVPLRERLIVAVADSYRRYLKLALALPVESGHDPHDWAWGQLQAAVGAGMGWIRGWYVLVCEGAPSVSGPDLPSPDSWRAPAWLYINSFAYSGIRWLKDEHIPPTDSEEKLGVSHSRLILKGALRLFMWALGAAIERVRNEETAAAGAIPAQTAGERTGQPSQHPKNWLKGTEGLVRKTDLSRYMHLFTDKQQMAFSLKYEYELGPTEIASRMGIDRKTVAEHLDAADRRIKQAYSSERRKAIRAENPPE